MKNRIEEARLNLNRLTDVDDFHKIEKSIADVMDNLNFEKIHAYMLLTNWTYYMKGVPTVEELREMVMFTLLSDYLTIIKEGEEHLASSSGGFTIDVWKFQEEDEEECTYEARVLFCIASWETF